MSKLSFVALSLQTTHLDPASVSKASYVKLVDGNITRQDDIPIIPPTGKKKLADEQSEGSLIAWDAALEQMGMMIGKLPIVSYYRDADKEIFQAASRQLNVEPPTLRWLDCRELARKLLPDLPDVQLSTVLKTLDLYDEFADSRAVEQTAQIVMTLAQRQRANTVEELWDELYNQPDDLLGLDATFEGSADSGSSSNDDEVIEGPLAAEVLPLAAVGTPPRDSQRSDAAPSQTNDELSSVESALDESVDESTGPYEPAEVTEDEDAQPAAAESARHDEVGQYEEETPTPSTPVSQDLPVFLQEREHEEPSDPVEESSDTAGVQDDHSEPRDDAVELRGDTTVTPPALSDIDEDPAAPDVSVDEDTELADLPETPQRSPYDEATEVDGSGIQPAEFPVETSYEPPDEAVATTSAEALPDERIELDELDEPNFLKEPAQEETEPGDTETVKATEPQLGAFNAAGARPENTPHLIDFTPVTSAPKSKALSTTTISRAGNDQSPQSYAAASEKQQAVQAIKVSELPQVEDSTRRSSKTNQIFGFVGLFVFGVLSIIGVVLIVMAVMLFFTENSLMLETKIAGVILTVAITLLSLLMTNVSYRSFRNK